jgi:taurine dioxygenase
VSAKIALTPLTPFLGARLHDVRLQDIKDTADRRQFMALVHKHQLVVVPGQKLDPDELISLANWLGKIDLGYPAEYRLHNHPEIFVISNLKKDGKQIGSTTNGQSWHTDGIYTPKPITFTMLYTLESPRVGGETAFTSTCAAYDSLPEETKEQIEHLSCIHSYEYNYSRRPNAPPMTAEMKQRFPEIRQPLVKPHPVTGRKGLFMTASTLVRVEGLNGAVDRKIVDDLIDYATGDRFVYRHHAEPGDFVIWDNAGTMHSATPYDITAERRLVYRIMTTD